MKFAWRNNIVDLTAWNSGQDDKVDLDEYCEMLGAEQQADELEVDFDEFSLD